ncbi:DUF4189 domain-containing protein [Kaistella sp. DKR-2]|uniref:FISUMP domain-containing protein n=1 Tax=Kaistella soli TaxID=2849654 RepID=UPI001C261BF0|nr:FISUMP domain-containing protein [Kaistella soli]MBU8883049.1 DUF4189 domain-containing protein [Kaistella soli]
MKKSILVLTLIAVSFSLFAQKKQPLKKSTPVAKTSASKFGALAVDRSNGYYYGYAFDFPTRAAAEKKAVDECIQKGGNCSVVLTYSGAGCAAYRTIDGSVGTAFGWGVAKTKEEADAIATAECLKRSGGNPASNFVWSCNSANTGTLKEIYNASAEIEAPVTIGSQIWMNKNLNVSNFRNGEPVFYASNQKEWEKASVEKIPAYCYLNFDSANEKTFGKLYNYYAVVDPRGLAPKGWHVPSKAEFEEMISALGGAQAAGVKMRATTGWDTKDQYNFVYGNGNNSSGLNLLFNGSASGDEYGGGKSFLYSARIPIWWSRTPKNEDFAWYLDFNKYSEPRITDYSKTTGCAVRIVKD